MAQLVNHTNIVHKNLKLFKCQICDKEFSTKRNMKLHILKWHSHHLSIDRFPKLKDHMIINDQEVQCVTCSAKFKSIDSLRMHIRIHT